VLRYLHLLAFILLTGGFLSAQVNTDSLLILAEAIPEQAATAKQLDEWVAGYKIAEFSNPVPLYQSRLELAKEMGDFQAEVAGAIDLIHACNFTGDFGQADSLSIYYVAKAEKVEKPKTQALLYHEAAKAVFYAQDYPSAINYDSSALKTISLIDDTQFVDSLTVHIQNFLGQAYNSTGQFVAAARTFTEAIERLQGTGRDSSVLIDLYTGLGIVYSQIGLYDQAVEYFDRSALVGVNLPAINKVTVQANIGRNLLIVGDHLGARDRYLKALSFPVPQHLQILTFPYAYNGLVEAHYRLDDRDSVNYYFSRYEELLEENAKQADVYRFLFKQSTWLHHLVNGRLVAAEKIGNELMDAALVTNDPADLMLYTEYLADTYRRGMDFERADELTRELMVRKDSVQSANRTNALLLFYNQSETKEKENEILRLDAERIRVNASRRLFQTAAGLLSLFLLMGGFFFFKLRTARRQVTARNEELSKLNTAKDRFFGIIAHDLRNPIVALKTADRQVNMLYEKGKNEDVRAVVGSISETASNLSGLLDNLLQWALNQSGAIELQLQQTLLAAEVKEIVALYRPVAAVKEIELKININEKVTVLSDSNALQTIIRNLVGNAVKFSGGDEPSVISLSHRQEEGMDVISVRDEGPGLSEDIRAQLFKLHRKSGTTGLRTSGTGLGLILCRDLAVLHGGRISVESEPGEGAVFSVWLPSV
jgi:signal transduction histidine kinase